jgi:hypothetical protein
MLARCRFCWVFHIALYQALALVPSLAWAVEYSAEPYVSFRTFYNDNFDLTTAPHDTIWGAFVAPGVKFNGEAENWKITGGADLKFNRYSESALNNTEGALVLSSNYRAERNTFGLDLGLIRDNTLSGELATTGVAQAYTPRNSLRINPSFSRALTEKTQLVFAYGFTAVNYEDTANTGLIDYRQQIVNLGVEQKLTERTTGTLTGYYDEFETDPANSRIQTVGIVAGIVHDFSETLRGSVHAGPRWTRSEIKSQTTVCEGPIILGQCQIPTTTLTSDVETDSSGYTATAALSNRWETGSVTASLGRELNPSGVGALIQTDLLALSVTQDLSPTWTATLGTGIYKSRYVAAAVAPNKSSYFRIEPRVIWRITPYWTLDAGYVFQRQKYEDQPDAASANIVYVTLSYTWQKIAVSR